jgi:hypothetical protein
MSDRHDTAPADVKTIKAVKLWSAVGVLIVAMVMAYLDQPAIVVGGALGLSGLLFDVPVVGLVRAIRGQKNGQ